jgi:putative ABC transport system permease protein
MKHKKHTPPRLATWLISRLTLYNERHSLNGDIEELYGEIRKEKGYAAASLWYWLQTALTVLLYIKFAFIWSLIMVKNYLKITFRSLWKHKIFSLINIVGLALSMAICLMIIIYVKDQMRSDQFHEHKDRILRVYTTDKNIRYAEVKGWATSPASLAAHLLENYAYIQEAVTIRRMGANVLNTGTAISISGMYVEPSFLKIFSYPLKQGDPETALIKPYSMIVSEKTAKKFFGNDDPINKTLTLEKLGDFTVTGVLKEIDQKSHFRFETLVSFPTIASLENRGAYKKIPTDWSSYYIYYTYLLLKNTNDHTLLSEQLPQVSTAIFPKKEIKRLGFKLQPLLDINLGINLGNMMPGTKHSFEIIFIPFLALLIIFLASFNYIILSIARSLRRTREIGMRKVIGAKRSQIIKLFLGETMVITFLALVVASLFILWLIPVFNNMDVIQQAQQQINMDLMKEPGLYAIFLIFALGVSLLAGLYPALHLSSFRPVNALQGISRIKGLSHLLTRKILLTIQFAVSLISIIFIIYFYQLHIHWRTFDKGINTEDIISVSLREVKPDILKNEIINSSHITGISFSNTVPVHGGVNILPMKLEGLERPVRVAFYSVDPEFIQGFQLKMIAGRNFSKSFSTDTKKAIIINEKTVQFFNLGSPQESIGKTLTTSDDFGFTVVGVIEDFNYTFPDVPIGPLFLRYYPQEFRYAHIRYVPGKDEEIKSYLSHKWKQLDKIHPLRYNFLNILQKEADESVGGPLKISAWACGFVVLIALLGLLGMATYTTERRVREIGVRKVFGAGISSVVYQLSKGYLKLILYAAIFALPAAYFLSESMMQFFAFRPELNLWVLPGSLLFILSLAIITIGSQTVKAALANPINTLREE